MSKSVKPIMRLTIEVKCAKKTFEDSLVSAIDVIESYGHAISIAKKVKGEWIVTEEGYLRPTLAFQETTSLPTRTGILGIDENIGQLYAFGKILGERNIDLISSIHFHYKDDHTIEEIGFDKEKRLYYLKTTREEYSDNEAMGLLLNQRPA